MWNIFLSVILFSLLDWQKIWDFPPANAGDTGSVPGLEDPTTQSSWARGPELLKQHSRPGSCNYWAHMGQLLKPVDPGEGKANEKPKHCNWRVTPTCPTWGKVQAARITHSSQSKWINKIIKDSKCIYFKKRKFGFWKKPSMTFLLSRNFWFWPES